jgi:glycosyltransferase involved in cell wall biosynthesis
VVASTNGSVEHLHNTLSTLAPHCDGAAAELIVVRAGAQSDLAALANQFPSVTYLLMQSGTGESHLRAAGFERSTRDVTIFLDDGDVQRQHWTAMLCRDWNATWESGGRLRSVAMRTAEQPSPRPALSVVIPVHNGAATLVSALEALLLTDLPRDQWEIVVVDDASTDDTPLIAARYADKLVRLPLARRGPGYARNRGFELAAGDYVTFINADVMVQRDTLRKSVEVLLEQTDVGAVFGSCNTPPMAKGLVSEYRNLVLQFYHTLFASSSTFSSACGTIRSSLFERVGGYDEWHFSRRQLEDLELGQRIRSFGYRILAHSEIRAVHLRTWTVRRMIATEIFDRAVPRMRLLKRQLMRDPLGTRHRRRLKSANIAVTWLGVLCALVAGYRHSAVLSLVAAACLGALLLNSVSQLGFFARERGLLFAVASVPLDILYYLIAGVGLIFGWIARQALGEPTPGATAEAFTEMGVSRWPPVPMKPTPLPNAVPIDDRVRDVPEIAERPVLPTLGALPEAASGADPSSGAQQPLQ